MGTSSRTAGDDQNRPGRLGIVAVTVEHLPVVGPVRAPDRTGDRMVHFHEVVHAREVQSTPGAPPLLPLQQGSPGWRYFGVVAQPARPVQEIAVVEAGVALDGPDPDVRTLPRLLATRRPSLAVLVVAAEGALGGRRSTWSSWSARRVTACAMRDDSACARADGRDP
jgi:hypothetical protein